MLTFKIIIFYFWNTTIARFNLCYNITIASIGVQHALNVDSLVKLADLGGLPGEAA